MKIKGNIDEIPAEFIWSDKAGLMTKELGKYAGSEKYMRIWTAFLPRRSARNITVIPSRKSFFTYCREAGHCG